MLMILIKIAVTSAMVLGLSWLTERVSPRAAGVFAGFPLGVAVSLFFLGVEQGPEFAATSSISAIGGLGASLVFCFAYWKFSDNLNKWNVVLSTLLSILVFLVAAAALSQLPQNRWLLTVVTLALTGLAIMLFRGIKDVEVDKSKPVIVTPLILLARAGVATVIVLVITGLASVIGEKWSGLLSGFPITLYPVMLIVHVTYSEREVHGIIKNFPFGIGSLLIFALCGSFLFVPLGIYWGSLAAVALATAYLLAVAAIMWKRRPNNCRTRA